MVTKDDFRKALHTALADVLTTPQPPIKDGELFSEYGLDSLDIMNLLLGIEDALGIDIGELEVQGSDCFDSLYEMYKEASA